MKLKKNKKNKPPKKPLFKGFSLTFRLSLGITLLIAFLMAAVGFATFMRDRNAFMEETYSRGWSTVSTVQTLAAVPLRHGNYRLLNELTEKLAQDPFINQAAILDAGGNYIAHNNPEILSRPEEGHSIKEDLSGRESHAGYITGSDGTPTALSFSAPIRGENNEISGFVNLAVDLSRVQTHLEETVRNILFNFVLAAIAGMILTRLVILRSVHRPVQSLVKATEKISTGDFSEQVQVTTRDELGKLGTAFNTMNEQLGVLFQSIRNTVSDMGHTSSLIEQRSDPSQEKGEESDEIRRQEIMKEINSSARRLTRMSDKLNSLALQFKTD